ncbi:ribosome biogenesis GTP-binding protein YihA/YsxC [Legionella israelensis]|uniref:Probable GTP-binding protein EngB n=1 Tax=Legionella israelensis TaxID=454 RepID=A0A0W0WJS2_9GAMM|nr:ribosome biogenesis GTP-binding protein YihA/YsxC [Legionella israelensis]KTD32601.1 ribosome biogenesis GTP-binding protein YsxC [Legionella israelensis]QBS09855.1 YihA family ribosome biogenesis GTP-binding protein [Legionella israelensis]SCY17808.1 GTP-binding protein [Legionella israelensis DSM 19235]STX59415.1 GTP binding protein EngB [Legionella israelensis]
MLNNPYSKTFFLKSAAKVNQLPKDEGYEVAFAGRSNAGKSSALNALTGSRQLARTSKTPGRTQLMNVFSVDEHRRLVDLPGYGYAKVALSIKQNWQRHLAHYLECRQSLKGLVLVMDIRHPLKELDQMMISWALKRELALHVLLTKADKLSRSEGKNICIKAQKQYQSFQHLVSVQTFSALKKEGLEPLIEQLNQWYEIE